MNPEKTIPDHQETHARCAGQATQPFNLAVDLCQRWAADRGRLALYYDDPDGRTSAYSFWDLQREANRLSNVLATLGTLAGDRVAIILSPRPEALIAPLAVCQMGAVAVLLASDLPAPAIARCLHDSAAHLAIVDAASLPRIRALRQQLPHLRQIISIAGSTGDSGVHSWPCVCEHASPRYTPRATTADDLAMLVYPDTTNAVAPRALPMAHGAVLAVLDKHVDAHDAFPQTGDLLWSPIDWASAVWLKSVVLPTWHFGVPLLAANPGGDPHRIFALLEKYAVRNVVVTTETLNAMLVAAPNARSAYDLELRTLACIGEPPGQPVVHWAREQLGVALAQTPADHRMPAFGPTKRQENDGPH